MLMSSVMISVVHSVWVVILIYVNELCYDLCSSHCGGSYMLMSSVMISVVTLCGGYMLMSSVMISVVHSVWAGHMLMSSVMISVVTLCGRVIYVNDLCYD